MISVQRENRNVLSKHSIHHVCGVQVSVFKESKLLSQTSHVILLKQGRRFHAQELTKTINKRQQNHVN